MTRIRPYLIILILTCACAVGMGRTCAAEQEKTGGLLQDRPYSYHQWKRIHTQYTIIQYQTEDDLYRFHASVEYGGFEWNRPAELSNLSVEDVKQMIIQKTDAIFERVQAILDMRKKFKPPIIRIHSNRDQLVRAYRKIYKGECRIRAWYRYRTNTVYLNVEDVHAGMVGHELAHAVIDHYLLVKPPAQTAEILARYVDRHL